MLYQTGNLVLSEIKTVRDNEDYKISVCKDLNDKLGNQYVFMLIKNKSLKRDVLQCMENKRTLGDSKGEPWIACFMEGEALCYVFSYDNQRKLESFAAAQLINTYGWEQATLGLVVACMSSNLPYPLLYLLIDEENINLNMDDTVFLTNFFYLEKFDLKTTEADCVERCANVVLKLLEQAQSGTKKKLRSLILIEKKVEHSAYKTFAEIYKDIKYCAVPMEKTSIIKKWWTLLVEKKDHTFKLLLAVSMLLFIIAVVMLIAQMVFGDASFFKFGYSIDQIGTELMRK